MSDAPRRRAGRPGVRTIFVAVTGLGSAALVTSISALNVGSDDIAVAVAVIGGTTVLGISALITLLSALRMPADSDRAAWAAAGLSLSLTTGGSGARATEMLSGQTFVQAGMAEAVYAAGSLLLIGVLLGWPWRYRNRFNVAAVVAETTVVAAATAVIAWLLAGRTIAASAASYGGIGAAGAWPGDERAEAAQAEASALPLSRPAA